MSLPKNCLYTNAIETSLARNYQSNVSPQNGQGPYGPGETIIVNIPTGKNQVMSGGDSVLKFSLVVRNGATVSEFIRLDKAGAHSLIQRVRIFHGSVLLSDIDNYNELVAMMMALQVSGDSAKGKHSVLSGIEQYMYCDGTTGVASSAISGERLNGIATVAANASSSKRTYTIPIMNFLSYSDKYVPLFALTGSPLRIEIQLVSNPLQAFCVNQALNTVNPILINDVEYIGNFMEISDAGMAKINSAAGPDIKWVVQDYRNYVNSGLVGPGIQLSCPVPAKFMSLRSLFFAFRTKSAGEITYFPLESNHYNLESYTIRLGSKTVPTKAPETYTEMYSELIRAIGSISDVNHEPNISSDYYNSDVPFGNTETAAHYTATAFPSSFLIGLDLESYSSSGMTDVYQGYNSSNDDIFFMPRFSNNTPNTTIRIDAYAMYDQVIIIQNGQASVSY